MIPVPDNCLTQLKYNQVESSVLSVVKKKKRTMSTYSRKKKPCLTMFRILSKRKPQNYIRSALLNLKHLFQIYHCGYTANPLTEALRKVSHTQKDPEIRHFLVLIYFPSPEDTLSPHAVKIILLILRPPFHHQWLLDQTSWYCTSI